MGYKRLTDFFLNVEPNGYQSPCQNNMGGFSGGRGLRPPFILGCFRNLLKVIIFRVVLCNHRKDVNVLWLWSEVALSPKSGPEYDIIVGETVQ